MQATVIPVLTGFDDYPIHQASVPVAHTATADINHYDRYFFNGYSRTDDLYFGAAMGLYPNRHVADAAFCVVRGGRQTSVFRSQRAPLDRIDATSLGPIVVEVLEPLRTLRVRVDAPEQGLRADLTFHHRSPAIEEAHFFQRAGVRPFFDYTRLTQFGEWTGWLELDGERLDVSPADVWGSRDRSWGVRPIGEPAPSGAPVALPQFFWLWAPVNFPSLSTHFDVNEHGDGRRWHETGTIAPVGVETRMMRTVDWRVQWRPGTRWADRFEYDLVDWDDSVTTVALVPRYEFHMRGIGYGHPEFGHGYWKGEAVTAGERLDLPVSTPLAREHVHVQALCDAVVTLPDGSTEQGLGILEQLAIGPHPTGLTGILDPFSG
ncbi:MAG: hypothetical protein KGR47_03045 [Acidobacteria bacterium]|nr:hypothetical protein [Acidobacteriota bacterium]